jgi:hypothetical protein
MRTMQHRKAWKGSNMTSHNGNWNSTAPGHKAHLSYTTYVYTAPGRKAHLSYTVHTQQQSSEGEVPQVGCYLLNIHRGKWQEIFRLAKVHSTVLKVMTLCSVKYECQHFSCKYCLHLKSKVWRCGQHVPLKYWHPRTGLLQQHRPVGVDNHLGGMCGVKSTNFH